MCNYNTDFNSTFDPDQIRIIKISLHHPYFPSQFKMILGEKAPTHIFCFGNIALLEAERTVMICGARNASRMAHEQAYSSAQGFAREGVIVSSGFARGIDMAAHAGALAAEGETTAYLPYGLDRLKIPATLAGMYAPDRFLAVTELDPHYIFTVKNALRRNKLMASAAKAVIVVEPGDTGGSWYSARAAADMGKPLYYIEGERPDCIERLESYGARRLSCNGGIPQIDEVLNCISG